MKSSESIRNVLILLMLILISMGCINDTERYDVDQHNEAGDNFVGTAICADNEVIYYNITCYVTREDDESKTIGKIFMSKPGKDAVETTTYDIYLTSEGWTAHFSGDAPMMKYIVGFGEYSQESYIECPAYSVHLIGGEIVIDHNVVESFELLN